MRKLSIALLFAASAWAQQSTIPGGVPVGTGPALPATCFSVGQQPLYFVNTGVSSGLWQCIAGVWTIIGGIAPGSLTVNGLPLPAILGPSNIGLGNVPNIDATNMSNATSGILAARFIDPSIARRNASNTLGTTTFLRLTALAAPTVTPACPSGTCLTTYSYKALALYQDGTHAPASSAGTTVLQAATLDASHKNSVVLPGGVTGCYAADVYRTAGGATQGKIASAVGCSATVTDDGLVGDGSTAPTDNDTGAIIPVTVTVATLPSASANTGQLYIVTDGTDATCATGGSTTPCWMYSNGTSWVTLTGGGGGGSAFPFSLTSGRSTIGIAQTTTYGPGTQNILVEPTCNLPQTGDLQGAVCADSYLGGLFNPANYGNLVGSYFRQTMYNGRNQSDNGDKKTMSGLLLLTEYQGAGQKAGINNALNCNGVGDCFAISNFIHSAADAHATGDEGIAGTSDQIYESGSLLKATTTGLTKTTCNTALSAGVSKSTSGTDIKTVAVASTAGCSAGDWVTVDNGPFGIAGCWGTPSGGLNGDTCVETVHLTAVGGGAISGLFYSDHLTGAPVAPSAVLIAASGDLNPGVGAQNNWGQGRIVVDLTATPNTGAIVSATTGASGVVGSGTAWDPGGTKVGPVGGDVNLPGCIAFTADNFANAPFSGGSGPLVSWFAIKAIVDNTHITLYGTYTGKAPTGSSAYTIRPCGRIGNLALTYGAAANSVSGIVLESNNFPWTSGHTVENTISPQGGVQHGYAITTNWYGPGHITDMMRISNTGYIPAEVGIRIFGSPVIDDSTHGTYSSAIQVVGNTTSGMIKLSGRDTDGSGIVMAQADSADKKTIGWARAKIWSDTSTGGFTIDDVLDGKLHLLASVGAADLTLNYSALTGARVLTFPDANGQLAISAPAQLVTVPATQDATIQIGTFYSPQKDLNVDVYVQMEGNMDAQYHFSAAYNEAGGAWRTAVPVSKSMGGANDANLEVMADASNNYIFRLRRVDSGGSTRSTNVYWNAYGNSSTTFTACSVSCSSTSAINAFWPSSTVTQIGGFTGINKLAPAYPLDVAGSTATAAFISNGATFTASGCSNSTLVGGATAGTFTSGTASGCSIVITMGSSATAPTGWACSASDRTTPSNLFLQTASSTTTATLTAGTIGSGDVVSFACTGY